MKKYVVCLTTEMMHLSDCFHVKKIRKKNRKEYDTFEKAKNCFDDKKIKVKYCVFCKPDE